MGTRSYAVILAAVVFAVVAEFVVHQVDSIVLAWATLLLLPIIAGAFAGYLAVPGQAGCLVVVLSITAFFVTGAFIATGSDASAAEEIISYVVLGLIMAVVGFVSYLAMRSAVGAGVATEIVNDDD